MCVWWVNTHKQTQTHAHRGICEILHWDSWPPNKKSQIISQAHSNRHIILHTPVPTQWSHGHNIHTNKWTNASIYKLISRGLNMAVAHTHICRIWLMSKWNKRQQDLPPPLGQLLFHHSPPLSPDNSCTTPSAHHSLPNIVGCVNTAHSHIHRARTVRLLWVSSPGLAVRVLRFS